MTLTLLDLIQQRRQLQIHRHSLSNIRNRTPLLKQSRDFDFRANKVRTQSNQRREQEKTIAQENKHLLRKILEVNKGTNNTNKAKLPQQQSRSIPVFAQQNQKIALRLLESQPIIQFKKLVEDHRTQSQLSFRLRKYTRDVESQRVLSKREILAGQLFLKATETQSRGQWLARVRIPQNEHLQ